MGKQKPATALTQAKETLEQNQEKNIPPEKINLDLIQKAIPFVSRDKPKHTDVFWVAMTALDLIW